MCLTVPQAMPLDQVVPAIIQASPLQSDVGENATVFQLLLTLLQADFDVMHNEALLCDSLRAISEMLGEGGVLEAMQRDGCALLRSLMAEESPRAQRLLAAAAALHPDLRQHLESCLTQAQ